MWTSGWRERAWGAVADGREWDLVVVGGGVAGAGVLHEAARRGLRALLVERHDWAWGASSRSSKLVHGGVRYLAQLQWQETRACVHERDVLVREAPGLVEPIPFTRALVPAEGRRRWMYDLVFAVYDRFAGRRDRVWLDAGEFVRREPLAAGTPLLGGYQYTEAQTDDARLVLRLLRESDRRGAVTLNYAGAESLLFARGEVAGVRVRDELTGADAEVRARAVVNATGSGTDRLRAELGREPRMRPLRGSHLVVSPHRLPVRRTISFAHPRDQRNVLVAPWEGRVIVGTTDLDHHAPDGVEPRASREEVDYLLEAARAIFPAHALDEGDVLATWAGVRPVVGHGKKQSWRESRESVIESDRGLVTVTAGKLTTFHSASVAVLGKVAERVSRAAAPPTDGHVFDPVDLDAIAHPALDPAHRHRFVGRYGADAPAVIAAAGAGEVAPLDDTGVSPVELRWAARAEGVVHLDDLLLRRTRLGLLRADGAAGVMDRVRAVAQPELGWSDERWTWEETRYLATRRDAYGVPTA